MSIDVLLRVFVVLLSPRSTPMATSLWVSRTTDACQLTLGLCHTARNGHPITVALRYLRHCGQMPTSREDE